MTTTGSRQAFRQSEGCHLKTTGRRFSASLDRSPVELVHPYKQKLWGDETAVPHGESTAMVAPISIIRVISDSDCRRSGSCEWPQELIRAISSDQTGAVVTFQGIARCDINESGGKTVQLNYHVYEPFFVKVVSAIVDQVRRAQPIINGIAIGHRVGSCYVGDVCVVVAVSAPHRKEAFTTCEVLTELLKIKAPVWKREVFTCEDD